MTGHLSGLIVKANTGKEKAATQVWWLVREGHTLGHAEELGQTELAPPP